jgi:hypothetical protein
MTSRIARVLHTLSTAGAPTTSRPLATRLAQWWCHHPRALRKFTAHALYLECPDCGHQSPGWKGLGK